MSNVKQSLFIGALLFILSDFSVYAITLKEAEDRAVQQSNLANQARLLSLSLEQKAQVSGEYADPMLNFGLFNLPSDDFSITQNPTTQFRVGIKQKIPRGSILGLKRDEKLSLSNAQKFKSDNILLQVTKSTRLAYVNLYKQTQLYDILRERSSNLMKLVGIAEQQFANGLATQQAIINAQLQVSTLDDKLMLVKDSKKQAENQLMRWTGDLSGDELLLQLPELNKLVVLDKDQFVTKILPTHPAIEQITALINSEQDKLSISQEMKKPGWTVGFEYRKRFGDNPDLTGRSDMLAMTASLDLPIFKNKKQNKIVRSNELQIQAVEQARLDAVKKLSTSYVISNDKIKSVGERYKHYKEKILSKAQENSQAALYVYQNGNSNLDNLLIAENLLLDARVAILNLQMQILIINAQLHYLNHTNGEQS